MKTKTPTDIERYQKHYSESGLLNKIGRAFRNAGMKGIYYVLLLYYVLMDENTPNKHKMLIVGTLGYFILPFDIMPDLLPALGYTDDIAALVACLKAIWTNVTPQVKSKAIRKLNTWFDEVCHNKVDQYDADIQS